MTLEEKKTLLQDASDTVVTIALRIAQMAHGIVQFKEGAVVDDQVVGHYLDVIGPYVCCLVESEDGLGREDFARHVDVERRIRAALDERNASPHQSEPNG